VRLRAGRRLLPRGSSSSGSGSQVPLRRPGSGAGDASAVAASTYDNIVSRRAMLVLNLLDTAPGEESGES